MITDAATSGNVVSEGNIIGLAINGTTPLSNAGQRQSTWVFWRKNNNYRRPPTQGERQIPLSGNGREQRSPSREAAISFPVITLAPMPPARSPVVMRGTGFTSPRMLNIIRSGGVLPVRAT